MALTHMVIIATAPAVRMALSDLFGSPGRLDLPDPLRESAQIVLAEALNNIVEHSYANGCGEIRLTLRSCPHGLACRISDRGLPMPKGDLPLGLNPMADRSTDLPEGGFGWFLIRALARELGYHRKDGCNHLSFWIPAATK